MSTIRTNTVSNVAGTGSPDIVGGELSRARLAMNGTGVIAIIDSFNTSSITDLGVGAYRQSFAVAFPNNSYSPVFGFVVISNGTNNIYVTIAALTTNDNDFVGNATGSGVGGAADVSLITLAVFGDKP